MFFVTHHITDISAAARAISDVLRPGGRLLIAGGFSERLHPCAYYHYLTRTRDIERQLYPTSSSCKQAFSRVGLTALAIDGVEHEVSPSLAAYSERLAQRAIFTFDISATKRSPTDWADWTMTQPPKPRLSQSATPTTYSSSRSNNHRPHPNRSQDPRRQLGRST